MTRQVDRQKCASAGKREVTAERKRNQKSSSSQYHTRCCKYDKNAIAAIVRAFKQFEEIYASITPGRQREWLSANDATIPLVCRPQFTHRVMWLTTPYKRETTLDGSSFSVDTRLTPARVKQLGGVTCERPRSDGVYPVTASQQPFALTITAIINSGRPNDLGIIFAFRCPDRLWGRLGGNSSHGIQYQNVANSVAEVLSGRGPLVAAGANRKTNSRPLSRSKRNARAHERARPNAVNLQSASMSREFSG